MEPIRHINRVLADIKTCFLLPKKMAHVLSKFDNQEQRVLRISVRAPTKTKTTKNKKMLYSTQRDELEPRLKGEVIQLFLNLKFLQEEEFWPLVGNASHHQTPIPESKWTIEKQGNSKCISGHIPKGSLEVFIIHRLVCFR